MTKLLDGKVAVVTGASRGIGRETALALAEAGAKVAVVARTQALVEETAALARAKGVEAIALTADIGVAEQAAQVIEAALAKFGHIDILVNNAGIARDNLLLRMKEEEWDEVMRTNLKGIFNCTKAVARPMLKQKGGKIINISSVVGVMGNAGQCNYAAAKAGIIGFTKSAARELASRGITVNAVAPGFITTDMTAALTDELRQKSLSSIPLARFGAPGDVAQAVLFLAGPGADYITGHVLHVDGGMAM